MDGSTGGNPASTLITEPLCRRWRLQLRNAAGNAPSPVIAEPLCRQ
jgi:hypothetical protein